MGRNPSASRREVLRGGTAALVGVGGLASSGTAIAQNRQVHADLNSSLAVLEAVWEHNGEQKLNQWSQQLRSEAIDAVNPIPGVEDLLGPRRTRGIRTWPSMRPFNGGSSKPITGILHTKRSKLVGNTSILS